MPSRGFVQKDLYLSCITTHLKSCCCGYIITFAMKLTPATSKNLLLPKKCLNYKAKALIYMQSYAKLRFVQIEITTNTHRVTSYSN